MCLSGLCRRSAGEEILERILITLPQSHPQDLNKETEANTQQQKYTPSIHVAAWLDPFLCSIMILYARWEVATIHHHEPIPKKSRQLMRCFRKVLLP